MNKLFTFYLKLNTQQHRMLRKCKVTYPLQ